MAEARNYHIKMSQNGYEALQAIAAAEKRLLSDVVREALEEYTRRKGHDVSFMVDRGGWRERDKAGE